MTISPKVVAITLLVMGVTYLVISENNAPAISVSNQKYANFEDSELDMIRYIIDKACTMYASNYDMISIYIYGQFGYFRDGFWNVAVYRKQDLNTNFYLTGTYDEIHHNKRYYQVTDA